ncbi:FAD-dependent oxidoreductase [Streptosporangium carneum]|uniref:FAD-dependent oxidoreductase n=1 Tax=Streptosporangium carneum TaxID=47481 RepID=A0A9W6I864_9ACTN|nr:FAD-dependent monooxygenase [Streptosporangium carneum]GLK12694.1 FAD-dependent oxidoreductase [Streptosporangium carneum]
MTAVRTALVIGGGIAGPVAAMALQRAGIESTVYEAYTTTADGVGGQLTIAPNGLDALRIIGADEAVRTIGLPMNRTIMTDGRGRPMGEFPALTGLQPSRALWRPDLYRALHDHAVAHGVRLEYGKRLVGVDETPTGVTARFADGSTATGDVLIGADGIRSTVRKLIDPKAPGPDHVPLLNFGAAADVSIRGASDAAYFSFGKRAFLGYWAQPDGTTAWFGNVPHKEPMSIAQMRKTPTAEWLKRLREIFADDVPGRELLQHTSADQLVTLGSLEIMPKLPHWYRGRLVLVGDSVHAPSSSSGQGASLAMESAIQLARCLRDLPDVTSAFAAYEKLRRDRVEKVAARAAKTNNSKALGPVAIAMMGLMMPIAMKTFLNPEKTLGGEQRYRIDWAAPVTAETQRSASRT